MSARQTFADRAALLEEWDPLPPLDGDTYARGHHLFEARSGQRAAIVGWLTDRLAARPTDRPLRVLSVGCGDGTVDAALATAVRARHPRRPVAWTGVEPHGPSATAFLRRVGSTGATTVVHQGRFPEDLPAGTGRFDVVTFVHSLYYVRDVAESVRAAVAHLVPGGELLVLHAPRGELNQVAAALAPETGGHPQWWDETVRAALQDCARAGRLGLAEEPVTAEVDLTGCEEQDPAVLEFAVQARLAGHRRAEVLALLASASTDPDRVVLPHPVCAFTLA
ncbi:hypothetical protein GCM10027047_09830 [Rhodococcus aerolatus]